jgi:peptidyl-prolyl cis-trans isomerase SurA
VAYPVSQEREEAARKRMADARNRITGGEAFADVAAEVSDDPTKARGGDLGWFSPGDLDPAFQTALDTLAVGELSEPVRSRFGYHLIEVLERDGNRFHVRHILAQVEPTDEDVKRARAAAETARNRILAGASFEDVAKELSEDTLTRDKGGDLGWTPVQYLLPQVAAVLDSVDVGDTSPVVESDLGFHVFKVLNRRSGGEYAYDEIKDRLRGFLEQKELEKVYDDWLAAVRDSAYVEIKTWER